MVSCENMKKGEVYKCQSCGFEIEVKEACDCGTSGNCETHDKNHGDEAQGSAAADQ